MQLHLTPGDFDVYCAGEAIKREFQLRPNDVESDALCPRICSLQAMCVPAENIFVFSYRMQPILRHVECEFAHCFRALNNTSQVYKFIYVVR